MALQEDRNINRITIVGGGTSGYLTAFHMAKTYPSKTITWIYPNNNEPIGVGESLVPPVTDFLKNLGVDLTNLIRDCNGTIKLGIRFENFNGDGDVFTFPFGAGSVDKYNTSSIDFMMKHDKISEDVMSYPDIAGHMRATDILSFLDKQVDLYPNLKIYRTTVDIDKLPGTWDLLIDCTGFKQLVSSRGTENRVSIYDKIPNNQAFAYRHPYTDKSKQLKPWTTVHAMDYGWIWHIPLGDRLAFGYVHPDKYDVKQDFIDYIESVMGESIDPTAIETVKMRTGRSVVHLKNNIVPIGLASCFIEPLESTGLYLTTAAVERLCRYIDGEITEDDYNEETNEDMDGIVDFIVAHYKYSKRNNEYWNHYKNVDINTYQDISIFNKQSWDFILSGFDESIKRPIEPIDPKELINISRGLPYHEWHEKVKNAKNPT
jgi:tryptophan halogenase